MTETMEPPRCHECRYWLADAVGLKTHHRPEAKWGWCQVKKEKSLVQLQVIRGGHRASEVGPMTERSAWCGEFEPEI